MKFELKVGDVVKYFPIMTHPEWEPVTVETEPYQLGDGTWLVKARRADGRPVYPCLEALGGVL